MTDEQINAAVHVALGNKLGCPRCSDPECAYNSVPDYCTDLNTMHKAENHLGVSTNMVEYTNALYDMACVVQKMTGRWNPYGLPARYRAEAFLRTLGKWEDGK